MKSIFRSPIFLENVLVRYLFYPDNRLLAQGNQVFFSVCLGFGIAIGSAVSVYVIAGFVFGIYHLLRGTCEVPDNRSAKVVAIAFFAYFLVTVLASLVHPGGNWAAAISADALFLGFIPLIAVVKVKKENLLRSIELSAALVPAILAPIVIYYLYRGDVRIEFSAGNYGIAAILAALIYLINLIAFFRNNNSSRIFSIYGAMTSLLILLFSGSRSMMPLILILPVFLIWCYRSNIYSQQNRNTIFILSAFLLVIILLASPWVVDRFKTGLADMGNIAKGDTSGSIGTRLELWRAAWSLFLERPIFGHGPGHVVEVMKQKTAEISPQILAFSHFHNAVLTELVRSGIVGLAGLISVFCFPIYEIIKQPESDMVKNSFALLIGVYLIYLVSGFTGIMLHHDLTDSIFLTVIVLSIYLGCFDENKIDSASNSIDGK